MHLRHLLLLVGAGTLGLISCGDDQISGPNEGTILVAALTTGEDFDQNGYTFSIDNGSPDPIGLQDTVFVPALEVGSYEVLLGGIADNCSLMEGTNPQTADVVAGDTVSVEFAVTCETAGPPGGPGGPAPVRSTALGTYLEAPGRLSSRIHTVSHLPVREITEELSLARKS
jgi:hypothetical protein